MSLSSDIVSQLVKAVKPAEKKSTEATVYGTAVEQNGNQYVQLDGSSVLTPVSSTVKMKSGERVIVRIKDHTAVVTGTLTPSGQPARSDDVDDIVNQITEFEIVIADKVSTGELEAERARIDTLVAENATITGRLNASEAIISELEADNATINGALTAFEADIKKLSTEKLDAEFAEITYATIGALEATDAHIHNLEATYGDFVNLTTEQFKAIEADIGTLNTDKLSAEEAKLQYANIDFANIGEAAIRNFFAQSGMIEDLLVSEGTITGTLTAVDINADYIKTGSLRAERLILLGDDGLFHEINVAAGGITEGDVVPDDSIHGSAITAKSITATQIFVDDLKAFGATIGSFNIGSDSIYSGEKESIDNATRGVYMDIYGQAYIGDDTSYIRFFKDTDAEGNEVYRLAISADSILFGADSKSSAADLKALTEHVKIGTVIDEETGDEKPCVELSEGDSDFKQVITNVETRFVDGGVAKTRINADGVHSDNVTVKDELRHEKWVTVNGKLQRGRWAWAMRSNGNYGLTWKE